MNNVIDNTTEIKQSKTKTVKLFVMPLLFVAAGIWIINMSDKYSQPRATLMVISGILSIVFFGMTSIFGFLKLFDTKPGIQFTTEGFIDHSSYAGGQLVRWSDVKDIRMAQVFNQTFISVILNNPEEYISNLKGLKKFFSTRNYKSYETPVHISPVSLQSDIQTLYRIFMNKWNEYKTSSR